MESISSRKNDQVRMMRELLKSAGERAGKGLFAAEGDHLCGELCETGAAVPCFMYTAKAAEKYPDTVNKLLKKAEHIYCITEELSEYISDTKAPQGLFASAESSALPAVIPVDAKRIVVLDGVQDPGNVGSVIRTAEALGIDGVILMNGCADALSPKTLRASMGSVFRIPREYCGSAEHLKERLSGFTIYAAMLDESAEKLGAVRFPERVAVVIGSEGAGVSRNTAEVCDKKIYIPIRGAESLNASAAAAVIMWEMTTNNG